MRHVFKFRFLLEKTTPSCVQIDGFRFHNGTSGEESDRDRQCYGGTSGFGVKIDESVGSSLSVAGSSLCGGPIIFAEQFEAGI